MGIGAASVGGSGVATVEEKEEEDEEGGGGREDAELTLDEDKSYLKMHKIAL